MTDAPASVAARPDPDDREVEAFQQYVRALERLWFTLKPIATFMADAVAAQVDPKARQKLHRVRAAMAEADVCEARLREVMGDG